MNGKRVVVTMLGGVAVLAALSWTIGLQRLHEAERLAEAAGARKLSATEAAERAAREDAYELPSRLEDAPDPAIERPWREGTIENPFPATTEGAEALFEAYGVSVRACRPRLTAADRAAPELLMYVTVATVGGRGKVVAVDGSGEGVSTRPFAQCLAGAFAPAVFQLPEHREVTLAHRLILPG